VPHSSIRGAPDPEFLDPAGSGSTPDPEMLDPAGSGTRPDPNALDPAGSGSSMILALPYLLKISVCWVVNYVTYDLSQKNLSSVLLRLHFMSVSIAKCWQATVFWSLMYYWKLKTCKYKNSDPAGSYLGSGSTPDPEMLDPDPVHPYQVLILKTP